MLPGLTRALLTAAVDNNAPHTRSHCHRNQPLNADLFHSFALASSLLCWHCWQLTRSQCTQPTIHIICPWNLYATWLGWRNCRAVAGGRERGGSGWAMIGGVAGVVRWAEEQVRTRLHTP